MSFDNTTEPAAKLRAALDRAEKAEGIAADLAAELQATRIALLEIVECFTIPHSSYSECDSAINKARKILDRTTNKEQH